MGVIGISCGLCTIAADIESTPMFIYLICNEAIQLKKVNYILLFGLSCSLSYKLLDQSYSYFHTTH